MEVFCFSIQGIKVRVDSGQGGTWQQYLPIFDFLNGFPWACTIDQSPNIMSVYPEGGTEVDWFYPTSQMGLFKILPTLFWRSRLQSDLRFWLCLCTCMYTNTNFPVGQMKSIIMWVDWAVAVKVCPLQSLIRAKMLTISLTVPHYWPAVCPHARHLFFCT